MKKLISLCLILAFVFGTLQIAAYADSETPTLSHKQNITILFSEELPQDIQNKIYAHFYGVSFPGDNQDNILCSLFGHKLTTTSTTVITHNVYSNAPRCVEELYNLSVCSRCDYVSQELISRSRIYCH